MGGLETRSTRYTQATRRLAAELAHCNTTIIQSSRSRSLPSGGPNLGKTLCLFPHLAPQMAGRPCPSFYYSLPIAASAVTIPTIVAPTVGPGRSGRCSAARSNLPINETVATGRMIAIGEMLQILPSSYVPATRPVTHSVILPIGTISLFVGLTYVIVSEDSARIRESPPRDRLSESQIPPIHLLASEYNSAHSNVAENSAAAEDAALNDDADSATPASFAGSITAASPAGSITQVSNMGDFEDTSILGLSDFDSGSENSADLRDGAGRHATTYMATGT